MCHKSVKNTKFIVSTWVLLSLKCTKTRFLLGLHLGLRWGAHDAPPNPIVAWGGGQAFLPYPFNKLQYTFKNKKIP